MENYSVTFTTRPSGIVFNHITDENGNRYLGIDKISTTSPGSKLGISIGDRLIAINNKSILNISSKIVLNSFHNHSLPFTATFKSCSDSYHSPNSSLSITVHHQQHHQYKQMSTSQPFEHNINNPSLSLNVNHNGPTFSFQEQNYHFLSVCKLELSASHFVSDSYVCPEKLLFDKNDIDLYGTSDNEMDAVQNEMDSLENKIYIDPYMHIDDDLYGGNSDDDDDEMDIDHHKLLDLGQYSLTDDETESVFMDGDETEFECVENVYLYRNVLNLFAVLQCKQSMVLLSSKGFNSGYHEWSVQITKCDVFKQEIGVISNTEIDLNTVNDDDGIKDTKDFGARACYGNELCSNKSYYASFNADNKQRISKDLSCNNNSPRNIGWCQNDVIKICMDLDKSRIKFYLNDEKVRKVISLQQNKTYYPIIWFSGNCQYELLHYE